MDSVTKGPFLAGRAQDAGEAEAGHGEFLDLSVLVQDFNQHAGCHGARVEVGAGVDAGPIREAESVWSVAIV